MLHLFGILFFIFLFVLTVGLIIVFRIARSIFRAGRKMTGKESADYMQAERGQSSRTARSHDRQQPSAKKKVFDDDEGEYVDFEEIKD